MATPKQAKPEPIYLKNHPEYGEKWLRERIVENPGIIGLGDLAVIDREGRPEKAGRLDLLLADPSANRRYEVAIGLGAVDEVQVIRCIDSWDVERRRNPGCDHVAVLVAEDVTSRFQRILGLFAETIPLVAIQLAALRIKGQVVLNFVRVLDQASSTGETPGPTE